MVHRLGVDKKGRLGPRRVPVAAFAAHGDRLGDVGPTTKPARCFRSRPGPRWRTPSGRDVPQRRRASGRQSGDRPSRRRRSTCSRSPGTSCMRPRVSACSTCGATRAFRPPAARWASGTRSTRGNRGTRRLSSGSASLPQLAVEHLALENSGVKRPARSPRSGNPAAGAVVFRDRRSGQPSAQYRQHRLRIRRGRGHPAAARQAGNCRVEAASACTSGSLEPSHVMRAMGGSLYRGARHHPLFVVALQQRSADRPSHRRRVRRSCAQLRQISPYWGGARRRR